MEISLYQEKLESVNADIILTGHTHIGYSCFVDEKLVINPGSVGLCDRDEDGRASYGTLQVDVDNIYFNVIKLKYKIEDEVEFAVIKGFGHIQKYRDALTNF